MMFLTKIILFPPRLALKKRHSQHFSTSCLQKITMFHPFYFSSLFQFFSHHFSHPHPFNRHRSMRSVEAQGTQTPQSSTAGAEDPHLDGDFGSFNGDFMELVG
jgi:hypothetical protein